MGNFFLRLFFSLFKLLQQMQLVWNLIVTIRKRMIVYYTISQYIPLISILFQFYWYHIKYLDKSRTVFFKKIRIKPLSIRSRGYRDPCFSLDGFYSKHLLLCSISIMVTNNIKQNYFKIHYFCKRSLEKMIERVRWNVSF